MGQDDADEGGLGDGCLEHDFVLDDFAPVTVNGVTGMAMVHRCLFCPAVEYEPSNVDRFPETNGLDPKLYPREVRLMRERKARRAGGQAT